MLHYSIHFKQALTLILPFLPNAMELMQQDRGKGGGIREGGEKRKREKE